MENQQLANELIDLFMGIKKQHFHNIIKVEGHTHNEKLVLFIMYDILKNSNDNVVSLSNLRKKIKLAPSTITPILNSLETRGLIERIIDKDDRRNIYLKLSSDGQKFTKSAHDLLENMVFEYIKYMSIEDIREVIRLARKTENFIKERMEKNEKIV